MKTVQLCKKVGVPAVLCALSAGVVEVDGVNQGRKGGGPATPGTLLQKCVRAAPLFMSAVGGEAALQPVGPSTQVMTRATQGSYGPRVGNLVCAQTHSAEESLPVSRSGSRKSRGPCTLV